MGYTATQPYYIVRWTTQWPGLLYKFGRERSTLQRNRIISSAPRGLQDRTLSARQSSRSTTHLSHVQASPYPRAPAHEPQSAPSAALRSLPAPLHHSRLRARQLGSTSVAPHRIVGHRAAGPGLYRGSYFRSCPLARRYTQRPHNEAHDHAPHLAPPGKRRGGCWWQEEEVHEVREEVQEMRDEALPFATAVVTAGAAA
eukprot:scaffold88823_cov72-Phaeocystis_antarctica.AAC.3